MTMGNVKGVTHSVKPTDHFDPLSSTEFFSLFQLIVLFLAKKTASIK